MSRFRWDLLIKKRSLTQIRSLEMSEKDESSPSPTHCSTPRNSCFFKETQDDGYPEGKFGWNQLFGCSMSLSPLHQCMTNDLHISIAYGPPPEFILDSSFTGVVHSPSGSVIPILSASSSNFVERHLIPFMNRYFYISVLIGKTSSPIRVSRRVLLEARNHTTSGTFHFPFRRTFHLSFTLLVLYRSTHYT